MLKESFQKANLQDLICGTIFVNQETIVEEKSKELNTFIKVYRLAQEIHALRLKLEERGDSQFQGADAKRTRSLT